MDMEVHVSKRSALPKARTVHMLFLFYYSVEVAFKSGTDSYPFGYYKASKWNPQKCLCALHISTLQTELAVNELFQE